MRKNTALALALIIAAIAMAGCGETIAGMSKDITRIGKGVKTVFIRNE